MTLVEIIDLDDEPECIELLSDDTRPHINHKDKVPIEEIQIVQSSSQSQSQPQSQSRLENKRNNRLVKDSFDLSDDSEIQIRPVSTPVFFKPIAYNLHQNSTAKIKQQIKSDNKSMDEKIKDLINLDEDTNEIMDDSLDDLLNRKIYQSEKDTNLSLARNVRRASISSISGFSLKDNEERNNINHELNVIEDLDSSRVSTSQPVPLIQASRYNTSSRSTYSSTPIQTYNHTFKTLASSPLKKPNELGNKPTITKLFVDESLTSSIESNKIKPIDKPNLLQDLFSGSSPSKEILVKPLPRSIHDNKLLNDDQDLGIAGHNIILSSSPINNANNSDSSSIVIKPLANPTKTGNKFLDVLEQHNFRNSQRAQKFRNNTLELFKAPFNDEIAGNEVDEIINSSFELERSHTDLPKRYTGASGDLLPDKDGQERSQLRFNTIDTSNPSKAHREDVRKLKEKVKLDKKKFKEVNKVRNNRPDLLEEMIINIPLYLQSIMEKVDYKEILLSIQINDRVIPHHDNLITFTRKSVSKYNAKDDLFYPSDVHLIQEKVAVLLFPMDDLIDRIEKGGMLETLQSFRNEHNNKFNNYIIILLEYDKLIKAIKSREQRLHREKIQQLYDNDVPSSNTAANTKKRKKSKDISVTLSDLESTISGLEINGFKIFPTKSIQETLQWLSSFTFTIASSRYDIRQRNPEFANTPSSSKGKGLKDTMVKMLATLHGITESKAQVLINGDETFKSIVMKSIQGKSLNKGYGRENLNFPTELMIKRLFTTENEGDFVRDLN
ncbi:hypothetical protein WICMUC_001921 [Wickerhamomyces mucosus]|uniref:ERCC4 domain-containing protein n=1 Tax=Wickerhamomyces mucosus TaxID=1378264 RepID=A0A9P8TFT2_9ASCO|nr:hypothetical protein WICMUC_001921 [Wickerhamomyces mucosus]